MYTTTTTKLGISDRWNRSLKAWRRSLMPFSDQLRSQKPRSLKAWSLIVGWWRHRSLNDVTPVADDLSETDFLGRWWYLLTSSNDFQRPKIGRWKSFDDVSKYHQRPKKIGLWKIISDRGDVIQRPVTSSPHYQWPYLQRPGFLRSKLVAEGHQRPAKDFQRPILPVAESQFCCSILISNYIRKYGDRVWYQY